MFDIIYIIILVILFALYKILEKNGTENYGKDVKAFFYLLVIIFCFRVFFLEFYQINGSSMEPTIPDEKVVFVNKQSYGLNVPILDLNFQTKFPEENEIVAFHYYNDVFIKRVKALPGDKLTFVKGVGWYVNDVLIAKDKNDFDIEYFKINLNNTNQKKIENQYNEYQSFDLKVPSGYIFVLGDNLDASIDSRNIGVIPFSKVIGEILLLG